MGATEVYFSVPGSADPGAAFVSRREHDLREFGHDPYSGTFGTVPGVRVEHRPPFPTFDAALDYCLENTDKGSHALAVRYQARDESVRWLVAGWAAD